MYLKHRCNDNITYTSRKRSQISYMCIVIEFIIWH